MLDQINGFFSIVQAMRAVDTSGVQPLPHPIATIQAVALRLRDDVVSEANWLDVSALSCEDVKLAMTSCDRAANAVPAIWARSVVSRPTVCEVVRPAAWAAVSLAAWAVVNEESWAVVRLRTWVELAPVMALALSAPKLMADTLNKLMS